MYAMIIILPVEIKWLLIIVKESEVGFEPTPTFVDQNAPSCEDKILSLESGALDHSAILTCYL